MFGRSRTYAITTPGVDVALIGLVPGLVQFGQPREILLAAWGNAHSKSRLSKPGLALSITFDADAGPAIHSIKREFPRCMAKTPGGLSE